MREREKEMPRVKPRIREGRAPMRVGVRNQGRPKVGSVRDGSLGGDGLGEAGENKRSEGRRWEPRAAGELL